MSLPSAPWPQFVTLSRDCTDDALALAIVELARRNQHQSPSPLKPDDLVAGLQVQLRAFHQRLTQYLQAVTPQHAAAVSGAYRRHCRVDWPGE